MSVAAPAAPNRSTSLAAALTWLAVAGSIATGARSILGLPLHIDTAWLLQAALMWLDGATLYANVIEVNPPLVIWGLAGVATLSDALGLEPVPGVQAFLFALALASATGSSVLAWRASGSRLLVGFVWVALLGLPGPSFGQREHIMVLLVLPYLLATTSAARIRPLPRAALGAAAGLGIALKPHFLLIWAVIEGCRWRATGRPVGPGTLAGGLVLAAYPVAVLAFTPEYFAFAWWVRPLYARFVDATVWKMVLAPGALIPVGALVGAFVRVRRGVEPLRTAMLVTALAALAAGVAQVKGFYYHFYPAIACSVLFLAVVLGGRDNAWRTAVTASAAVLALTAGRILILSATKPAGTPPEYPRLVEYVSGFQGRNVAVFSPVYSAAFPLILDAGARWTLPAASLWPLYIEYWDDVSRPTPRAPDRMPTHEAWFFHLTVDAFVADPPAAVLVDPKVSQIAPGFDPVAYFSADPEFARVWQDYVPDRPIGVFRTWVRRPAR